MTKYGKIYHYFNRDEAEHLIGEPVAYSKSCSQIDRKPEECIIGTLEAIGYLDSGFKMADGACGLYIREIIEEDEPKLMTHSQLSEWCAKGHGEWAYLPHNPKENSVFGNSFHYSSHLENEPVDETDYIRYWGTTEWIKPTVDIYNRDCGK